MRDVANFPHNPLKKGLSPSGQELPRPYISFEEYMESELALRSILSLQSIVERAEAKAKGVSPLSKIYFDSPLKVLKIFVQNSKKIIVGLGKASKMTGHLKYKGLITFVS